MQLINGILVLCAIERICLFVNGGETIALKNISFDDETYYGPLFSSDGYPKPGDIPMLNRKVFRGIRVSIIEHPYIVSIRRRFAHHFTGTLISKNVVISIAHPIINIPLSEFNVVAGENYSDRGAIALTIVLLVVHEKFDPYTLTGDVALMRMFESVTFRVNIKPILRLYQGKSYENKIAFVTGWGRCDMTGRELCLPRSSKYFRDEKMDPMLRTVTFALNEHSHQTYCEGYKRHGIIIKRGMLCLGVAREENPVTPCMAVPGAPLVVGGDLLGIQSWGFGCGYNHDLPLIYTDMRYYNGWITYNTNILKNMAAKDFTQLFEATRARVQTMWLKKTRAFLPSNHQHRGYELQPIELDRRLARLKGNVFDLRDFINRREFHEPKKILYSLIRVMNDRADKLIKIMHDNENKKYTMTMVPFFNQRIKDDMYSNDYGQAEVQMTEGAQIFKEINDYGQMDVQSTEGAQIFKDINDYEQVEVQSAEDTQIIADINYYGKEEVQSTEDTQIITKKGSGKAGVQNTEDAQNITNNDSGKVGVQSTEDTHSIVISNNDNGEVSCIEIKH